jgi:hypothetical protein
MKNYQFGLTENEYKYLLPLTNQLRTKFLKNFGGKKTDFVYYYFVGTYKQYEELMKEFK